MSDTGNQSFLRRVLILDAVISGATGALMALGAGLLAGPLALPAPLLLYAGLALLPFAGFVAYMATRPRLPRGAAWAIVVVNAIWVVDSLAMLAAGWVAPSPLGYGFVLFQAAVVALLASLQALGLRRLAPPAALG